MFRVDLKTEIKEFKNKRDMPPEKKRLSYQLTVKGNMHK